MDDITEEEQVVIDELKRRTVNEVTPKLLEDVSVFYRFAKARDFVLAEAEAMLRKVLVEYAPSSFICFDKKGSCVRYIDCGRADAKGLWDLTKKIEMLKYFCYHVEKDKDRVTKSGRNLEKMKYASIFDFENLTYANAVSIRSLQYIVYVLKTFQDNYPESVRRIWVINAPFYFSWIHSAVKPILPDVVLQKMRIYDTEGWKQSLLEDIDPDDLPAFLGGNKTDPDGNPLCETFIMRGKPIPKSYYASKRNKTLALASDVEKLTVTSRSKEEITLEVREENLYLEWELEVKNRDINFSLTYRGESFENPPPVEILPKRRIDSGDDLEKGCHKCEKVGNYTFIFDNSYSWFHAKEVYYRIGIKQLTNTESYSST